jgi:putative SOS response-associated peptidase YedK
MCKLYRVTKAQDEVPRRSLQHSSSWAMRLPRSTSRLVFARGELRSMVWGFPLATKGKSGQPLKPRPVNNTRADKLDSFMWRYSFAERRCLIPVTEFAEAKGEQGAKTRTWFALNGEPVFAVAGLWRDTKECSPAYSMVMTETCIYLADVHDRMPVIVDASTGATGWTGHL